MFSLCLLKNKKTGLAVCIYKKLGSLHGLPCSLLLCSLIIKNVKVCTEQKRANMGSFSNDLDTTKSEDHGVVQIKEMKEMKKNNFLSR